MSAHLNEEDFVVYVNPLDDKRYQEVYASQVYGTFFAVFARFHGVQQSEEGKYHIGEVELKVVNYKGLYDLGLVNVNVVDSKENSPKVEKVELNMRVMNPMNKENLPEYEMTVNLNRSFTKGDVLCFERTLFKLHDEGNALNHGLFDNEFYYREGISEIGKYETRRITPEEPNRGPGSGIMCAMSYVIIS